MDAILPSAPMTTRRSGRSRSSGARSSRAIDSAAIGSPERRHDVDRAADAVFSSGLAVERRLRLRIGQPRRRAHHARAGIRGGASCPCASNTMRTARQARSSPSFSEHRSADKCFRQHRHDAVGEIDGVAALVRFAVERGARRHVMRDVGDGDDARCARPGCADRRRVRPTPHRHDRAHLRDRW